jgi:hypothetical protein
MGLTTVSSNPVPDRLNFPHFAAAQPAKTGNPGLSSLRRDM